MFFFRRKSDMDPPPPLPKMECPIKIQQLVLLGRNILFRTEDIQECKITPSDIIAGWQIKGTAFYRIPKHATDILIERSVEVGLRNVYTVSYKWYGAKYKEIVIRSWTASDIDEYVRRYLIHYEILNVVPDFK